jgi:hypothetical protein
MMVDYFSSSARKVLESQSSHRVVKKAVLAVVELIVLSDFVIRIAIVNASSLGAVSVARLRVAVWLSCACVSIEQLVATNTNRPELKSRKLLDLIHDDEE